MTIQRMIELLEIEHECMLRGAHDVCDRNCADCELVQDDGELHEMYASVIALLKEQEKLEDRLQLRSDDRVPVLPTLRKGGEMGMINRNTVIKAWEIFRDSNPYEICDGREFRAIKEPEYCMGQMIEDTIALLKEQENEYENGFNDAMLGKQELMYEGTDGKWHTGKEQT